MLCYHDFSPQALRQPANTDCLSLPTSRTALNVDYLAFKARSPNKNPPVIILSGAFQTFVSFQVEVERLTHSHPVIIVELPSQGSNLQLVDDFSLYDYAELLHAFIRSKGLTQINLIGLSYGSAMALIYAALYPDYCHRLILSGITCFKREDMLPLLNDSFNLLQENNMQGYATLALCNLINHNRLAQTGIQKVHRRLLYRQVKTLQDVQRQRHISNTQRLIDFTGFKQFPACPTLVVAGEFDNFTQADEQAATAMQCANAQFAIIDYADHLIQLEKVEAMAQLGVAFFNAKPLNDIAGVTLYAKPCDYVFTKTHIAPLAYPHIAGKLITTKGDELQVSICALNVSEFIVQTNTPLSSSYHKLEISTLKLCFYIHILPHKSLAEHQVYGIFSHQCLDTMHQLLEFITPLLDTGEPLHHSTAL